MMHVSILWRESQYPTFKIILRKLENSDPFLEVLGCRIIDGKNGPFISYPARKDDQGKFWPHVYGGEAFNAHVLQLAQEGRQRPEAPPPRPAPPRAPARPAGGSGFDDMQDDPPF